MKIIIVVGAYFMGGAEFHAFKLAKYLKKKGHLIEFWVFREGDGTTKKLCFDEKIPTKRITEFKEFLSGIKGIRQIFHYVKIVREFKPDAIISFNFGPNIWNGIVSKYAKVPCAIWSQQSVFNQDTRTYRMKNAVKNMSCFLSNAPHVSNELKKIFSFRNSQDFKVVYNGIEQPIILKSRNEWRNTLSISQDCLTVTMVANLTEAKDHITLVKAWKIVVKESSHDVVLVFAGRKGNQFENIQSLVNQYDLKNSIKIIGSIRDIAGLNAVSDLGVLSSKAEGLPNAVMEQMIMGLPIVGTANNGIREAVGLEMYKYLSPVNDAEDLASKILLFLNNSKLRKEVGLKNKRRIEDIFSVEKMGRKTLEIVQEYVK